MTRRESREHIFRILFRRDFYPSEEWKEQAERCLDTYDELGYADDDLEDDDDTGGKRADGSQTHLQEKRVMTEDERSALMERALAVCFRTAELDEKINEAAEGWTTARMSKVDLTIIRLALYEIDYDDDIPTKVAINEAVELARKFGGDESPAFVNGVLARLVK